MSSKYSNLNEQHLLSGASFTAYLHSLTIQFCHNMCDIAEQNGFGATVAVQSVVQSSIICKSAMTQAQYDAEWLENHSSNPTKHQPCLAIMLFWGIYEASRGFNNSEMVRLGRMQENAVNVPDFNPYLWTRTKVEAIVPREQLPKWWRKMADEQDEQWTAVHAIAEASKMGQSAGSA